MPFVVGRYFVGELASGKKKSEAKLKAELTALAQEKDAAEKELSKREQELNARVSSLEKEKTTLAQQSANSEKEQQAKEAALS